VPNVKLTNTQQHYMQLSYSIFQENLKINMKGTDGNPFTVPCTICPSLCQSLHHSATQQNFFGHFLSWILCRYLKYALHLTDYYGILEILNDIMLFSTTIFQQN